MSDDVRKKQLFEKIEKRIIGLRTELQTAYGQGISDDALKLYVDEEIQNRRRATIEDALKMFESGEELLALKEYVERSVPAPALETPPAISEPAPVATVTIEPQPRKQQYRKFRGR